MPSYRIAQLDALAPVQCPCGIARRPFADSEQSPASVHLVQVQADARAHYHNQTTEIYLVLEGEGFLELDDQRVPVKPLTAVMIHPGCRHRAIGNLKIINLVVPAFDERDEREA